MNLTVNSFNGEKNLVSMVHLKSSRRWQAVRRMLAAHRRVSREITTSLLSQAGGVVPRRGARLSDDCLPLLSLDCSLYLLCTFVVLCPGMKSENCFDMLKKWRIVTNMHKLDFNIEIKQPQRIFAIWNTRLFHGMAECLLQKDTFHGGSEPFTESQYWVFMSSRQTSHSSAEAAHLSLQMHRIWKASSSCSLWLFLRYTHTSLPYFFLRFH